MEVIRTLTDIFLHLDKNLATIITQFGPLTYVMLFSIIFLETGFVITPFLPGDSLLFAAGTLSAGGPLNILFLFIIFAVAAILGDSVNYWIGKIVGPRIFEMKRIPLIKKENLIKTEKFYEKYGGKTIILARFIPIIRTFAPFVAGIGKMNYATFITYNFVGGLLWVSLFLFSGYLFGNLPIIKENFHYAVVGIILVSIIPIIVEYIKHLQDKRKKVELQID